MRSELQSDCSRCFGLCCVALPYAKSADFPTEKNAGVPCHNLQQDFRCQIHEDLRENGFKGCTVYECFGAGQKVSQYTYKGADWRTNPDTAAEMFDVFPIMQQLHEMLLYLTEAASRKETETIKPSLLAMIEETETLTLLNPKSLLNLNIPAHRSKVNELLLQTSRLVRGKAKPKSVKKNSTAYLGAKLKGADLKGASLRGALMIAADLRNADMRQADFIGADLRDVDLRGADLTGSLFLTQAQINSAYGNKDTRLPLHLSLPAHWST
ncbi:pentapeptide repeat-containing protein [Bacillus mangrovi]|uniref:Pentapeptide repeat-containing protein n=1 Tax=Metabacillus mangrovi TaxID=1491830 RepID=A0A7X2S8V2_9BACI|nr:pentapeptide repeat-containing protein [Metabacillus mangrovi]MTH54891.1 pentapeptide repeat-containing protein [Metabacillus mangrovi]